MARPPAELDQAHVWHPFTQMSDWAQEPPLVITAAEGVHLIDADGRRYLDGTSSLWVNVHGHREPRIDRAIVEQLGKVAHSTLLGLASEPAARLAERLVDVAPDGLTKVFYSDDGSTAVEVALKMAYQCCHHRGLTDKRLFVRLDEAYHGDTLGAVSVGGIPAYHRVFGPLLFETRAIPSPYCYRCPLGRTHPECDLACADALETILDEEADQVVAVVIEPIFQGAAGFIVQPPGYLQRIGELARRYGVLLIADEVATGFGRTGTMFACEQAGITPDFLCLAKGLTGGYLPLAATLATQDIYDAFLGRYEDMKTFFHGHSYTGNALGAAAALASLDVFRQDRVLEKLEPKIRRLAGMASQFDALPIVGDIRHVGLVAAFELVAECDTREPFPPAARVGHRVAMAARREGVILRPLGNTVYVMPPLAITESELAELVEATFRAIDAVGRSWRRERVDPRVPVCGRGQGPGRRGGLTRGRRTAPGAAGGRVA